MGPQQPLEIVLPYCWDNTLLNSVKHCDQKFAAVAGGSTNYSRPSELWRLFSAPLGRCFPHMHERIVSQQNIPRRPFEALGPTPSGCSPLSHFGLPAFPAPFVQLQGAQEAPPGLLVPSWQSRDSLGRELKQSQGSPHLFPHLRDHCPIPPENWSVHTLRPNFQFFQARGYIQSPLLHPGQKQSSHFTV